MFSIVMKQVHRRGYIDQESYVAQYLALTLLTIGIASTLGTVWESPTRFARKKAFSEFFDATLFLQLV
jgi:hypothetical protein